MNNSFRVLISNDDGVYAEGIETLYDVISEYYPDTWVVAPDRNQSAASHSLTLDNPLRVQKINRQNFIAVKGTPTDSVYLAINQLLKPKPKIVLSGINLGPNLGDDVIYSGTVAAAMEGRNLGLPALAISLCGHKNYKTAAHYALKLLNSIHVCPIPENQIINVNVPDLPLDEIKGVLVTKLGRRYSSEIVVPSKDLRGESIYWVGPQGDVLDNSENTDFWAVANGFVSLTPLHIDLTSYNVMDDLCSWVERI